jgi:hypothetical protein
MGKIKEKLILSVSKSLCQTLALFLKGERPERNEKKRNSRLERVGKREEKSATTTKTHNEKKKCVCRCV